MPSFSVDPETTNEFKAVFGGVCTLGAAKPIHDPGVPYKGDQYAVGDLVAYDTVSKHAPLIVEGPGVLAKMDKRTGHVEFPQGDATKLCGLRGHLGL